MPPPQPILASRVRGFVCISCILKSQRPRKQWTPWLAKNFANDNRPPRPEGSHLHTLQQEEEPAVRYFDQAPDGTRREIQHNSNEVSIEELESTIQNLERRTGKSIDSLLEESENGEGFLPTDPSEFSREMGDSSGDVAVLEAVSSQNKELEEQIQRLGGISDWNNISAEDRTRLRESLLKPITKDVTSPAPRAASYVPATAPDSISSPKMESSPGYSQRTDASSFTGFDINVADFPIAYRPHIASLRSSLIQSSVNKSLRTRARKPRAPRLSIWKAYLMSRPGLLSAPSKVPLAIWSGLWKVFAPENPGNLDRMTHIKYIGDDMRKAGVRMTSAQRLLYIEAIFIEGDHSSALKDWELAGQSHRSLLKNFEAHWELGIRMFCQTGQIDEALQAAENLLQDSEDAGTYRILLPIIKASLSSGRKSAVQRAWALYIRMRVNLGDKIKMEDYDAATSIFLSANKPDLALGVFNDMMLTGDASVVQQDSTQLYRLTTGINDDFKSARIGEGELRWEDSRTLAKLPAKFNNKFFFGSWIKKLIGDGELDNAKKVFDLMHDRRICPASIHVNGLIGAWFREGTEESRILAEDWAWRMIKARLEFVKDRDLKYELNAPLRPFESVALMGEKRPWLIPLATIETFTILLQQYRRRQKNELVSDLFNALRQAKIPPNTYFMNELMWMDTRNHKKGWAWDTYQSLKELKGASPDLETYKILWHNMQKQLDPVVGKKPEPRPHNFTTCKGLFAEMMQRAPALLQKGPFPRELYDSIILCFSYEQDQIGTAVALRALQRHFNMFPSENTARTIVLGLARLGLFNELGNKPRRLDLSSAITQERISNVTKLLQTFKTQRIEALRQQGIVFEQLKVEAKSGETIILLTDLLRHVAMAKNKGNGNEPNVLVASQQAAENMGAPDCAL